MRKITLSIKRRTWPRQSGRHRYQSLQLCALHLQSVRQRKLKEMEAEGVPAKYRAELARKKMTNW